MQIVIMLMEIIEKGVMNPRWFAPSFPLTFTQNVTNYDMIVYFSSFPPFYTDQSTSRIWHWSIYWSRPLCICNFQFKHIIPQHYIAWIVLLEGIGCGSSAVLQQANTETITDFECGNYWNNIGQEHQCVYNGQTSACMVRTHVWSHLAMNRDGEGTTNLYGITGWLFWHVVFAFPLWLYLLGQREPLESVYRIIDVVPVKKQPGELPCIKMLRWGRGGDFSLLKKC